MFLRGIVGLLFLALGAGEPGGDAGEAAISIRPLTPMPFTAGTGEKPQSKVWRHAGNWWAVLPCSAGTKLWRLDDTEWVDVLHLADSTTVKADVRAVGEVAHILLYDGVDSRLVSVEYDAGANRYAPWSTRPQAVRIPLEPAAEIATIDVDPSGRMWLASDDETAMHVRWSDAPYDAWSRPIALATDVSADDICAITAFPDGSMGFLWSNQTTKRYGFRVHAAGAPPEDWAADEIPAAASAIPWHNGMADDHLNMAVASNGTLYAAVKTSYDTEGYPLIALLVRRPSGAWDRMYSVDDKGTRGIVLLNEEQNTVMVVYTSGRANAIVCRASDATRIAFGPRQVLMRCETRANNATSTKQNVTDEVVILASREGVLEGARVCWEGQRK
ncbi:MAG: T9SS C-terminal target domain-containing protein [Candidatus Hydrogenedentes bacterium]|nr:T9SS C-terminal target domain-containing protein [Candidatus Hydrogenedentota bacterium]